MRIDNQHAEPGVRLSPATKAVLILGVILTIVGSALWAVAAALETTGALTNGEATLSVSLNPGDLENIAAPDSPVSAVPAFPSYGAFELSGLSDSTTRLVATASVLQAVTVLVVAGIAVAVAVRILRRRLRWAGLATSTAIIGAIILVGGTAGAVAGKSASDAASAELLRADGTWTEPGFLAGLDLTATLFGAILLGLALLMRITSRHAEAAYGVV